jgi:hypothetical protein
MTAGTLVRALTDGLALSRRISAWNTKPKGREGTMGIDLKKYIKGRFYSLDEVFEKPAHEQIAVVKDGQYNKPVLVFESGRQAGLNQISLGMLMRELGDDTDAWIGHWVELGKGETKDQNGNMIDCLTVWPETAKLTEKKTAPPTTSKVRKASADMNDDIPF